MKKIKKGDNVTRNSYNNDIIFKVDKIIKKSNIPIQDISYKLMMLELEEKIEALPGQNYRKRV